ncbi:MAG: helix-turn-helix domain-containing protein [Lachnospiraceae bacterium]|nr:helix-turn-helix domain-containing protein [Lachnospiraceae bacterium]
MDCQQKVIELRKRTGMNRKEFCEYFMIPYRTVTEWERGTRNAPEYVLRMMEYMIRMEKLGVIDTVEDENGREDGGIDCR